MVAYFFRRGGQIVANGGAVGLLSTNSITQGEARRIGLEGLLECGWTIFRAVRSRDWPLATVSVSISQLWLRHGAWAGAVTLDGAPVSAITPALMPGTGSTGPAHQLVDYRNVASEGSKVYGEGFVLSLEEAHELLATDAYNVEVVRPYLTGVDLNSSPARTASRFVIDFRDWPLSKAQEYSSVFLIAEERVKPERLKARDPRIRDKWWQYERQRRSLYDAIASMGRVLVTAFTSKTAAFAFVPADQVFANTVVVFGYDDDFHFGLLSSGIHYAWVVAESGTMRSDLRYFQSACFETFPQPSYDAAVEAAGKALDEHRSALMIHNDEGLTKTYNRVHNAQDTSPDIAELRELHVALDLAVRDAYGWSDLDLDHGFHETPQGVRFTLGPAARAEVLDRLLELNHERYAEEVAAGLHGKKPASESRKKRSSADAPTLL